MISLKRSENAGPEKAGLSSQAILGRSEGATGGLPTRAVAENAGVASMSPNAEWVAQSTEQVASARSNG